MLGDPLVRIPAWFPAIAPEVNYAPPFPGGTTRPLGQVLSDRVSVLDFNAVADGDPGSANRNAAAFNAAIATGKAVWVPWSAQGYHLGKNQITVPVGSVLLGEAQVRLKSTAPGSALFRLTGLTTIQPCQSQIDNFQIDMTGAQTSSVVTFSVASPGIVNWTGHGIPANAAVYFTNSGGALPAALTPNVVYYVINPTANTFQVSATYNGVGINFAGAGTGTSTGFTAPTAIRYGTGSNIVQGNQLSRLNFSNCWECIGDEASNAAFVAVIKWYDITCNVNLGRALYLRRSNGFLWFDTVAITRQFDPNPVTYEAARFENVAGIEFNRFDVLGGNTAAYSATATGLVINNGSDVFLNRILIDSTNGNGMLVNNCARVHGNFLETFACLGYSMQFVGCSESELTNVLPRGATDAGGAAAQDGLTLSGCIDMTVANVTAHHNTGNGITVSNTTTDCILSCITNYNNTGWGLQEASGSNANLFSNMLFAGNGSGDITTVGTFTRSVNWITNAGPFNLYTGGPAAIFAGTAGVPALTSINDRGTGMYFPAAGFVALTETGNLVTGVDGGLRQLLYNNSVLNFDPGAGSGDTGFARGAPGVQSFTTGIGGLGGTFRMLASTPSALASGATNNYVITASYFQRITANAANSNLTGMGTTAGQVDGEQHLIINIGTGTLTLNNLNAGSSAANQFQTSTGADVVLSTKQAADCVYDGAAQKWLVFKRN